MFTPRAYEDNFHFILRMAARTMSVVVFVMLLFFYISDGSTTNPIATREIIGLLFFPIGLLAGFAWSWHSELPGGLLSIGSTAAFYVIYGLLLSGSLNQGLAFLVFTFPAFLFTAYGFIRTSRMHLRRHNTATGH